MRLQSLLQHKFEHHRISRDILAGKHVLDIGCGRRKLTGAVGLDFIALPEVDIVADLNFDWVSLRSL